VSILAPFDEKTQLLLNEVDNACRVVFDGLKGDVQTASLEGDDKFDVDMETAVWLKVIRAYGILFNRGIDAGWIKGIMTKEEKV